MKERLIIIFIILIFLGCDQNHKRIDNNNLEIIVTNGAEREIIPKQGDTINVFFDNSNKIKEKKFTDENYFYVKYFNENGIKEHLLIYPLEELENKTIIDYNEDGVVTLIANYTKGIADGSFQEFYENGNPKKTGTFNRIRKDKIWKYYNENCELIKQEWYSKGQLIEKIEF